MPARWCRTRRLPSPPALRVSTVGAAPSRGYPTSKWTVNGGTEGGGHSLHSRSPALYVGGMTTIGAAERRTQAQRRAASRARLLDAAVDCLAERGYGGTTLPEIVRRAELSNGALWRHFRSKNELLVAAA